MSRIHNKNESLNQTNIETTNIAINQTEIIRVGNDIIETDNMIVILMDKEENMIAEIVAKAESFIEEAINNL